MRPGVLSLALISLFLNPEVLVCDKNCRNLFSRDTLTELKLLQ